MKILLAHFLVGQSSDPFIPFGEVHVPDDTDELRLAIVKDYDGEKIIVGHYKESELQGIA